MHLQKNIIYLKNKNSLTVRKIAEGSGLSIATVFNFIHSDGLAISIASLIKLAKYFNLSIDDLIYKDLSCDKIYSMRRF